MNSRLKFFFILFCLSSFSISYSQNIKWIKQFGGYNGNDEATCIKSDKKGNIFVVGDFKGSASGNSFSLQSLGYFDMFLAKYNESGSLYWVKQIKSNSTIQPHSLSIDKYGNIYITGWIRDTTYFDSILLIGPPNDSLYSGYFVVEYDSDGDIQWAKQAKGGSNLGNDVAIDSLGNIYTTGLMSGTSEFGNNKFQCNNADIFIAKYRPNKNISWIKKIGGNGFDEGGSIAIDKYQNLYSTGEFSDTITFDNITLAGSSNPSIPLPTNIYLAKLDTSGNTIWADKYSCSNNCWVENMKIDNSQNILICGEFNDTIYIGDKMLVSSESNVQNVFFAKLKANGQLIWIKQKTIGNPYMYSKSIAIDKEDNYYLIGYYDKSTIFDSDVFVTKYDSSGNRLWEKHFGGSDLDEGYSIDVSDSGNIFISGAFWWQSVFDSFNLLSNGYGDAFWGEITMEPLSVSNNLPIIPKYALKQNYPNPFNPVTNITFTIPARSFVSLKIYNIEGRELVSLVSKEMDAGKYTKQWNADNFASGVYFYRLTAGSFSQTKKLLLLK